MNLPTHLAVFLLGILSLVMGSPVNAAIFIPTADAFVNSGNSNGGAADKNYGGAGALVVSATGSAKGEFQSFLKFDGSAIKTSLDTTYGAGLWTIQSITLQLTAAAANNAIFDTPVAGNFNLLWMAIDTFTEGTGTPAAPTTDGITFNDIATYSSVNDQSLGTFSYAGGTSGAATCTLTLSSGLLADISNGTAIGFHLSAADATVSYLFNSRSIGTAASRPTLTVTAVPEPGSIAFIGLGLAGLGVFHHRRRR